MNKIFFLTVVIFIISHGVNAQARCDTISENIFVLTEIMPEPIISMNQVETALNTSIDLGKYQISERYSIYVNFYINCKGEDFNYKIVRPKKMNKESWSISYFQICKIT